MVAEKQQIEKARKKAKNDSIVTIKKLQDEILKLKAYIKVVSKEPKKIPKIPDIPEEEKTGWVVSLLEICHLLKERIQVLEAEIAYLKGQTPKPKRSPSQLENKNRNKSNNNK